MVHQSQGGIHLVKCHHLKNPEKERKKGRQEKEEEQKPVQRGETVAETAEAKVIMKTAENTEAERVQAQI